MSLFRRVPVTWDVDILGKADRLPAVNRSSPAYFDCMDSSMNKMYHNMREAAARGVDAWRLQDSGRDNPIVYDEKGNRKFRLEFDVCHFKPEEVSVQIVGRKLTVSASHEEVGEGREISRNYSRTYTLPTELNVHAMVSRLSPQGLLVIEAPLPVQTPAPPRQEVVIPIQHCSK